MATAEQPYARVAKAVVADVHRSARTTAAELLPKGGPGAESTTRERTIQHFRAAWPYPELRQALFRRIVPTVTGPNGEVIPAKNGQDHWDALVAEAFPLGYPEPLPPMVAGAGGFEPVPY